MKIDTDTLRRWLTMPTSIYTPLSQVGFAPYNPENITKNYELPATPQVFPAAWANKMANIAPLQSIYSKPRNGVVL